MRSVIKVDLNNDRGKVLGGVLREFYPQDPTYLMVDINELATKFFNGQRFGKYKITVTEKGKIDSTYKIETFERYLIIDIKENSLGASFLNNFETKDELRKFIKGFVEICDTHLGRRKERD